MSGRKMLIIGRKGSGKSAICTHLMVDGVHDGGKVLITPDDAAGDEILRFELQGLPADSAKALIWRYVFAVHAARPAMRQAEGILADVNTKADRIRSDSERELAALTSRRDSISAQPTNVRQLLAQLTGPAEVLESTLPQPQFELVRRGYDREQVDAYVHNLRHGHDEPQPDFMLVRRGYDRQQVDTYITALKQLTGHAGSTPA